MVDPAHITNAERRQALGLDDPDWVPPAYNPRLASSLDEVFAQGDRGVQGLRDIRNALALMQTGLRIAADQTEPSRRPMTEDEVASIFDAREERATARNAIRRERRLTWAEAIEEQMDSWPLNHTYRPFLQGRNRASPPLVKFVEGLATSWHRAFGKPPPVVRPPSTSAAADRFTEILRAFEICYRRRSGELDKSVFETAIRQFKVRGPT